ncbi:NopRA1 domain-containing protein [Niallia sp. MER 6]|uniref:NopRA1 domain-containing protein n=1 Tax=unclassified Niallia TaxID=2837522 RepID=UPI00203E0DED|nr:NopRA1 domain-containing protein [Niallia sp. MER 6]MCM3031146.1 NopRA1 domain-containing protein [Niallia sp. MER 6]
MRKELLFAFTAFFFMSLSAITGAYALENEEQEKNVLQETKDINGDGKQETIGLNGILSEEENDFYTRLTIQITDSKEQKSVQEVDGGFNPQLELIDLDGDGTDEMFLTLAENERGSKKRFAIYDYDGTKIREASIPELPVMTSSFKEDYKAELVIEGIKTYNFDLYERKNTYEQLGLYQNGHLNESTELIISPFSQLKPSSYKQKLTLEGKQMISGIAPVDKIAYLETVWTNKDNTWKLEKIKVKEISKK